MRGEAVIACCLQFHREGVVGTVQSGSVSTVGPRKWGKNNLPHAPGSGQDPGYEFELSLNLHVNFLLSFSSIAKISVT